MANYIKSEILAEAYSHLNVEVFYDKPALAKLKSDLTSFFEERAKFMFGDKIKVEVEFEEGSLITKIKIVGKASIAIAVAMTAYGGFRQAIDYLEKDATVLAQSANLEMVFRTKAAYCDRVAVEKRRGIFGRIDQFLGELDLINRELKDSTFPTSTRALSSFQKNTDRLIRWQERVDALFNKLDSNETKACVAAGFLDELTKFPPKAPWANELKQGGFRAEIVKADPVLAGRIVAGATQLEETVRYIRKYYENIVKQYAPKLT